MEMLNIEEVIDIHNNIIKEYGGLKGTKDYGQLESSLNNAFTTFFGEDLYKTDLYKISNIFYLLVKNHSFNDANKRTAVTVFNILIVINDINLIFKFKELEDLAIDVTGNRKNMNDVDKWIDSHKESNLEVAVDNENNNEDNLK